LSIKEKKQTENYVLGYHRVSHNADLSLSPFSLGFLLLSASIAALSTRSWG